MQVQARAAGEPTPLHRRHGRAGRAACGPAPRSPRSTSSRSARGSASARRTSRSPRPTGRQAVEVVRGVARPHPRPRARAGTAALGRRRGRLASELVKVAFLVNDLQLSGGVGVVIHHARQLHPPRPRRLARARARAGPAALGLRRAGRPARRLAARGAAGALRRRGRDLVGDDLLAVHGPRRALRVLRPEPRGPLLRARDGRAARRRGHARPAGRVHHRGALDPRHARRAAPGRSAATSSATGSTSRSSRPPTGSSRG